MVKKLSAILSPFFTVRIGETQAQEPGGNGPKTERRRRKGGRADKDKTTEQKTKRKWG